MYSTKMIPFLTSSPTNKIAPMNDETLSGVPVIQSANSALVSDNGCARKTKIGSVKLLNCTLSIKNTSAADTISHRQQTAERLLLAAVTSRQFPAISAGKLHFRKFRLQIAVDRAQIAVVQLGGYRDDRLLVLSPQFVGAAHDVDRRELCKRHESRASSPTIVPTLLVAGPPASSPTGRASGQAYRQLPQACRSNRTRSGYRTRMFVIRSSSGTVLAT